MAEKKKIIAFSPINFSLVRSVGEAQATCSQSIAKAAKPFRSAGQLPASLAAMIFFSFLVSETAFIYFHFN